MILTRFLRDGYLHSHRFVVQYILRIMEVCVMGKHEEITYFRREQNK